jgi:predicted phage terminase large subunit-like protein
MVIQQRVSEKDVSGHILSNSDKNDWVKLILPMEFEPSRRAVTIPLPSTKGKPWQDPRAQPNELMWPTRIGPKELDNLKKELSSSGSSYAIAGQLQQRPAPESGGIYKREWFKLWPAHEPFPKFDYVVASYDTAYTDFKGNDPTACTVWGIFVHPQERRQCAMLLDCYAEWIDYPDLRRRIESDYKIKYGPKEQARKADYIIIETKGSGDALHRDLRRTAMPVIGYSPGKQGKKQRARVVSYLPENGMVYLPESENKPGKPKTWCEDFLSQLCTFPNADHDDYVDSFSQAMIHLKDRSLITADKIPEPDDQEVAAAIYKREQGGENPYAV